MTQKRKQSQPSVTLPPVEAAPILEPVPVEEKKDKTTPILWRVFGAAVVGAAALLGITVYQQINKQISGLRQDLGHLGRETKQDFGQLSGNYGSLLKKQDASTRIRTLWDTIKELRGDHTELTAVRERCAMLSEMFKASDEERKRLKKELQTLREQQAAEGERAALVREIRTIRQRIATLEGKAEVDSAEEQEKR